MPSPYDQRRPASYVLPSFLPNLVTMRLFVAINLPKKERQRIERAARPLRDGDLPVRWVGVDDMHLTLKFLGPIRADRLPRIEAAMERVANATRTFPLGIGGFGAFPTIRRPRTIWVGVDATPELRCLKQDLEWALAECGFETETRAFHPHITLGRADDRGGAGAFRGLDDLVAAMEFKGAAHVRSLDLMQSRLSRTGASYALVSSARLASA